MYASNAAKFLAFTGCQFCIHVWSVCSVSVLYGVVAARELYNVAEKLLCKLGRSQPGQWRVDKFVPHAV